MDFQSVCRWDGVCVCVWGGVTGGMELANCVCVVRLWPGGWAKGKRLNFTREEATEVS